MSPRRRYALVVQICQLGIIVVPVIVYVWTHDTTTTALIFTIWSVPVMLSDNFLKPILMGRGVEAPMLVIFVGAIGGFMLSGIIGLFTGAVILVVAYELFLAWLDAPNARERAATEAAGSTGAPT